MILHDFIYEWDGKSKDGEKPIAWWPGRYHVRIVKTGDDSAGVKYLFPIAVIFKSTETRAVMNVSLKNYLHNFAEKIGPAYDLDIEKVMWVELEDPVMVGHLNPDRIMAGETLYTISWRSIRPNELAMIDPYIQDF